MVVFSYSGKRSTGRSATAAAAYRSASIIKCDREGRMHDYTAKRGVEACFILAPDDGPEWAQDRAALRNAAEAREKHSNSVTAREWELALPSEAPSFPFWRDTRVAKGSTVIHDAVDIGVRIPVRSDQKPPREVKLSCERRYRVSLLGPSLHFIASASIAARNSSADTRV
jgi:hypothetical protein